MDCSFRGRVDSAFLECNLAKVGTDVNNAAAALREHCLRSCLRCKEHALHGGVEGLVKLVFSYVKGIPGAGPTCIVDKNIDSAEGFDCFIDERVAVFHLVHVGEDDLC